MELLADKELTEKITKVASLGLNAYKNFVENLSLRFIKSTKAAFAYARLMKTDKKLAGMEH